MMRTDSALAELASSGKPIGVGIIGLGAEGSWGEYGHKPALATVDGYELRALSASSAESAKRSGEVHGIELTFGSAAELAACDEVDLVVVAVKVPPHLGLVETVLDSGKAVFCEWPLGNGVAEAERLADQARARSLPAVVGLQARSHPAVRYVAALIADGYVGEVLSTTVIGSGSNWGPTVETRNAWTLDASNGGGMLEIPFGHTLDGIASALGEPADLRVTTANRRTSSRDIETGETVPMTAADQVVASGTLPGGGMATFHYRGGLSRGINFRWEINGTEGDIVVTAPIGHIGIAPLTVEGARGADRSLAPLPVPADFIHVPALDPVTDSATYAVAHAYHQLLEDLRQGTSLVPDFDHGVRRHRSLQPAAS